MSIRIKDIGGRTLYVADKVTTVKKVLEEANLFEANLRRANLGEANLRRANLVGANLGSAYLVGADLGEANLRGANLFGANLRGAVWRDVASALKVAVEAMNDGGRHWIKGALESKREDDGSATFCSIGAIKAKTSVGTPQAIALWLLESVCGGDIADFNDDPTTTWEEVQAAFAMAIRHAERFAARSAS